MKKTASLFTLALSLVTFGSLSAQEEGEEVACPPPEEIVMDGEEGDDVATEDAMTPAPRAFFKKDGKGGCGCGGKSK